MARAVERLTTGVQGLAELLGRKPPVLPTAASLDKSGLQIVNTASSFTVRDDGVGIWDDDEERRFYEQLPELANVVPPSLLGIKKKTETKDQISADATQAGEGAASGTAAEATGEEGGKPDQEDVRRQLEQLLIDTNGHANGEAESVPMERGDSSTSDASTVKSAHLADEEPVVPLDAAVLAAEDGLQSGPAARLTALFAALPEAVNREMVDKLALEFAYLNSKAARKRLVQFLSAVPKDRTDLLPHYSRFVAILDPYMPDIGRGIIDVVSAMC